MQVADVLRLLDQWAPLTYSEDFDNTGLLVGNAQSEVRGILVSLDTLESVVDEAIAEDCNLVVSFHPIIFSGLKSLKSEDYVSRAVVKAIKNDIAIIAIHTALDNMPYGVSWGMAKVLDLQNTQVLMPKQDLMYKLVTYAPIKMREQVRTALFAAGAGAIGNYDECSFNASGTGTYKPLDGAQPALGTIGELHTEPETQIMVSFLRHQKSALISALKQAHPYEEVAYDIIPLDQACPEVGMGLIGTLPQKLSFEELLKTLKSGFNCGCIKYSKNGPQQIQKVAVLGGSGSFAIDQAKALGAQVYITADLKYHDYFKGQEDFAVLDIGHYESEQFTKDLIVDYLSKKITNFAPSLPIVKVLKIKSKDQSYKLLLNCMAKKTETTVEEKLRALFDLQLIDSRVDEIRNVRGELPLEVEDLADEVAGLNTRLEKLGADLDLIEDGIKERKNLIEEAKALIKKYTGQQDKVRNNREYNSLSKEIEFQELEIQLAEKQIREHQAQIEQKNIVIEETKERLAKREEHLKHKQGELNEILAETEKEEQALLKESEKYAKDIEERLYNAYKRIRGNVKNGLAVVAIERGASGGSFFTIPPQVQMEIAARKKIITDEHSGRILVDPSLADEEREKMEALFAKLK